MTEHTETDIEQETVSTDERARGGLGLGAKLMAAFGVCAVLTVGVSGLAWFNVGKVGTLFGHTVEVSLPNIERSLGMEVSANRLAAYAEELGAAASEEKRAVLYGETIQQIDILSASAGELPDSDAKAVITASIEEFRNIADTLNTIVLDKFSLNTELERQVGSVDSYDAVAAEAIPSIVTFARVKVLDVGDFMLDRIDEAKDLKDAEAGAEEMGTLLTKRLQPLQAAVGLQTAISNAIGLLNRTVNAGDVDHVVKLESAYLEAVSAMANAVSRLPDGGKKPDLESVVDGLIELNDTNTGLFSNAKQRLERRAQAADLISQKDAVIDRMSVAVRQIVEEVETESQADVEGALVAVADTKNISLALGALSVLVALGIGLIYVRGNILKRLTQMLAAMQSLAGGSLETEVPDGGSDEIGDMARALEVFRSNALDARNASEQRRVDREKAAAERKQEMEALASGFEGTVSGIVTSVTDAATVVQGSAQSLSSVAETSRSETASSSGLSDEMTASMQSVSAATEEMSASIAEIGQQVTRSVDISNRAVEEVGSTDRQIADLSKSADEIGSILSVISDIAEQTNLLALNATIEAARAGDAGKGFAVVANEVKSLAGQTVRATEQIAQQISSMQSATRNAVNAVAGIGKIVSEIDNTLGAIAGAVEEQSAVTQNIAQSIAQSTGTADSMANSIERVAKGADETGGEAERLLNRAEAMNELSAQLNSEIDRFLRTVRAA